MSRPTYKAPLPKGGWQPQADWGILSLCDRSPKGRLSLHRLTAVPLPLGEGGFRAATCRPYRVCRKLSATAKAPLPKGGWQPQADWGILCRFAADRPTGDYPSTA